MQDRKRETADALQNVGGDSSRKRRAITHTFIIIALSGTVCKGKKKTSDYSYLYYYSTLRDGMQGQKIERKARFYGLVWNINKPTIDELSSEVIT